MSELAYALWQDRHAILADRYTVVARDRKRGPSHADAKAIRAEIMALRAEHGGSDTIIDDALAVEKRKAVIIAERSKIIAMAPPRKGRGRREPAIRPVGRPRAVDIEDASDVQRQCVKCRTVRPISQYERTTTGNYRNVCNPCRRDQKNNRERKAKLEAGKSRGVDMQMAKGEVD